jgi:uncharacterized damage-inducible protein DinB
MLARIRRLLRYDEWANREALASAGPPRALRLMAHVLGAEWLWLHRLRRTPPAAPVWPEWSAEECAVQAGRLPAEWTAYLADVDEAGLATAVEYVNSTGERWSSTVEDVLLHVVLHSAYHRGQVAAEVRAQGGRPAYTDFIHAVRQRRVE